MRFVLALVLLSLVTVRTATGQRATAGDDAAQLTAIEHRIERALVETDTPFLEGAYAPEFRFKHASGNIDNRAAWLAGVSASRGKYLARDLDSLDVEVHGDIALTTGRVHSRGLAADGSTDESTIRYVRVYALRAGHWQLLTHHTFRLTKGAVNIP
jgi:hypothetical protein